MSNTHFTRTRWCAVLVGTVLAAMPLAAQIRTPATTKPCTLVPQSALRLLLVPRGAKGVPDSTGATCTWGRIADRRALVLTTFAAMTPDVIERMRIGASKVSDPILEPTVAPGAWSTDKPFGRVFIASKGGHGLQLTYYTPPHSKGADRVDVRATNEDRLALLEVAKVALARF